MIALIYKAFQFQKVSPKTEKKKTLKLIPLKRCNQIFVEKQNMTWNSVWKVVCIWQRGTSFEKFRNYCFPKHLQTYITWNFGSENPPCSLKYVTFISGINSTSSFTPLLINNYKTLWRSTAGLLCNHIDNSEIVQLSTFPHRHILFKDKCNKT